MPYQQEVGTLGCCLSILPTMLTTNHTTTKKTFVKHETTVENNESTHWASGNQRKTPRNKRCTLSPSAPQKILSMNPLLERLHRQYLHLDFGLTTIVILSWEASVSLEHTSPTFCLHIISTDHQVTLLIV